MKKFFFSVHWCNVHTNTFPFKKTVGFPQHLFRSSMSYLVKPKPFDLWSYTNVDSFERQATMTTGIFLAMLFSACFAKTSMHDLPQTCHMKKEDESAKRNRYSSSNSDNRVKASCCILCNLKYFIFPQTFLAFLKIFCFASIFFFFPLKKIKFLIFFDLKIFFFKAEGLYWRNLRSFYKSKKVFNRLVQNK